MKILTHGNAPFVNTGYGVQARHLLRRLHDDGHDVAHSCTFGLQGSNMPWSERKIRMYMAGYETNGNDSIHNHAMHHFGGDEAGGWIIPILDVWCLNPNPRLKDFNVAAWTPVDHVPAPRDVVGFFHKNPEAIPIAMSRFGERELSNAGLDPVYIPLSVDTKVFKPTPTVTIDGQTVTGRELLGMSVGGPIPDDAYLVGMVAMNKGWARDRKGFNEAFRAFGHFWLEHQNAVMYVHADWPGAAEGIDLRELAVHASIPEHAIRFVDQYAYRSGFSDEMMAAMYTSFDVLLAPSHGEGFCVPLIEAQACGTPVITSDFSTGPELVGDGWLVGGQLEWDPPNHASYICPYTLDVIRCLEESFRADRAAMAPRAILKAAEYDVDLVFDRYWRPFLASLDAAPEVLELDRSPIPAEHDSVAVIVPAMRRPQNVGPLVESLRLTTPEANVYFVCDPDDVEEIAAVEEAGANLILSQRGHTYATKANVGLDCTDEPWIFLCGDDVRFTAGWLGEARKLSDRFDVIGTNDTTGPVKNPDVAAGRHSDHCLFRRSYLDVYGASLEGPGTLAAEAYQHWYVDKEQVELAKARAVFTPCLTAVVDHQHPGYDGREDLRQGDSTYMLAVEHAEVDRKTWMERLPLIQMQRTGRGKR